MRAFISVCLAAAAVLTASWLYADPPTYEQLDRLIKAVNAAGHGGGGGGGPGLVSVDGRTVTTNYEDGAVLNGVVSIRGARTAAPGTVPRMGEDGHVAWSSAASGSGAVIVEGVSGSAVTTAVCTNKLVFVSSPESNVKFTVTDRGGGDVEVRVGVFYK